MGDHIQRELEILNAVHGIGVILLDEQLGNSRILVRARERLAVDWDSCNRLAMVNKDFQKYMEGGGEFYQDGKFESSVWDVPQNLVAAYGVSPKKN